MTSMMNVQQTACAEQREANHVLHCVQAKNGSSLWVGSLAAAHESILRTYGITHVVNCTVQDLPQEHWTPYHDRGIRYAILVSDDQAEKPVQPAGQWDSIMTFLQQAWQSQKNILIHCWAGKNRSVTTAAIFMVLEGLASSFEEAVQMIQSVRPVANPDAIQRAFGQTYIDSVRSPLKV